MPRYYGSEAEMLAGIKGYSARANYTAARNAARAAELNSPEAIARAAHMRHANEDHRLRNVIVQAEDHVGRLHAKLAAARRQADHMAATAYRSGEISEDAAKVKRQIEGLPSLIARAEGELASAREALETHQARSLPTAEPEAEPVDAAEAKRGPGRPRKGAA